jgi:hypothetical protein
MGANTIDGSQIKMRGYAEPTAADDEFNREAAKRIKVELLGASHYPEEGQTVRVSADGRLIRIEAASGMSGRELYGLNWEELDNLLGRILTLADAAFAEDRQCKAFKDGVRQHFKEWMNVQHQDAYCDAGMPPSFLYAPFVNHLGSE